MGAEGRECRDEEGRGCRKVQRVKGSRGVQKCRAHECKGVRECRRCQTLECKEVKECREVQRVKGSRGV